MIALARNFGKEAALTAGIEAASGDMVVPIDADLQDPPELIAEFVDRWEEGYDVVYGARADRSSDTRDEAHHGAGCSTASSTASPTSTSPRAPATSG